MELQELSPMDWGSPHLSERWASGVSKEFLKVEPGNCNSSGSGRNVSSCVISQTSSCKTPEGKLDGSVYKLSIHFPRVPRH